MYWLDLDESGFALSSNEEEKQFYLKKVSSIADQHIGQITKAGFKPADDEVDLFKAPYSYRARNTLLSLNGAFLYTTSKEVLKNEEVTRGIWPIRSTGIEVPRGSSQPRPGSENGSRNTRRVPESDGRGSTSEDSGTIRSEENRNDNAVYGLGAPTQPLDSRGDQGSGDNNSETSKGRPGIDERGISDVVKETKNVDHNPNHFYLNTEENWSKFSPRERFNANIEAIVLSKKIEKEERPATIEEKTILSKYSGWGGVDIRKFGHSPYSLAEDYNLTSEEQNGIKENVLDAFYTSPEIIKPLWDSLENEIGFSGGEMNEPAIGIGNFIGYAPEDTVKKTNIHATELDTISGRIAQQIYPDANILIRGYEEFHPPANYFDLSMTNVPFGKTVPHDKKYNNKHSIHNYFICKSLDHLKPGGIGIYVTSAYTMDSINTKSRREMNEKANLLTAVRMPISVLKDQANVDVSMDVLIFQKRVSPRSMQEPLPEWIDTHTSNYKYDYGVAEVKTNNYFINHPECLAGNVSLKRSSQPDKWNDQSWQRYLVEDKDRPFTELFPDILKSTLSAPNVQEMIARNKGELEAEAKIKIEIGIRDKEIELTNLSNIHQKTLFGSYVVENDKIFQVKYTRTEGLEDKLQGIEITGNPKKISRLKAFVNLKNTLNYHLEVMKNTDGDAEGYITHRALLNQVYNDFVDKFGHLNEPVNFREFISDPESCKIITLENYNQKKKTAKKANIFSERVIGKTVNVTHTDSVHEAVALSLDKYNTINIPYISELTTRDSDSVVKDLEGEVFRNPETQKWELAAQYLSGNVRKKLQLAEAAAEFDAFFEANVKSLQVVIPKDIPAEDIGIRLGVSWVPTEVYRDFISKISKVHKFDIEIRKRDCDGAWQLNINEPIPHIVNKIEYGTDRRSLAKILKASFEQRVVSVYDTINYRDENGNDKTKQVYNHKESVAAQEKQEIVQNSFREFCLGSDPHRTEKLVRSYNDKMNAYVAPRYDGSHLTFPGLDPSFIPRSVQSSAVFRAMHKNVLLNHEVGVGKTFEQIAIAMTWKRLGIAKKPLMVVANNTLEDINTEAQLLYPGAKILMVNKDELSPKKRQQFAAKVAFNEWDLVIMAHSTFERLPMDTEFEIAYLQEMKDAFEDELNGIKQTIKDGDYTKTEVKRFGAKAVASKLKTLSAKISKLTDVNKDEGIHWSDLGVNALLVDEGHRYKNLMIPGTSSDIATIQPSQRAMDLLLKVRYIEDQRKDGKGIVFATGTPITNSPLEVYNMQRYLQNDDLKDLGLDDATSWYSSFLYPQVSWEPSHAGTGWNQKIRPCFDNVPELMAVVNNVMDTATADQAGIVRPKPNYINTVCPMSPAQAEMMQELDRKVNSKTEHIFKIMHTGRNMALDPRLVLQQEGLIETQDDILQYTNDDYYDPEYTKLNQAADQIAASWVKNKESKGTQLVFSDLGVPNNKQPFNVYDELKRKIVERGVPSEEIRFIHDFKNDKEKAAFFETVRTGEVRIAIASTEKMGIGTNVQDKLTDIHHLDAPWTPDKITQRNGRGLRFGNNNEEINLHVYTTEDTFDLFQWNLLKLKDEQIKKVLFHSGGRKLDFETSPSYAETAALTSGNPLIKEKLETEEKISRLEALYNSFLSVKKTYDILKDNAEWQVRDLSSSLAIYAQLPDVSKDATFKIKAIKYGDLLDEGREDKPFEFGAEDIATVSKMMRTLRKKTLRTRYFDDTLTYDDVPIHSYQKPNNFGATQTIWKVGDIERGSLARAVDMLVKKDELIALTKRELGVQTRTVKDLTDKMEAKFDSHEELTELKIALNVIVRKIEVDVNGQTDNPVYELIISNSLEEFKKLVEENPDVLDLQDEKGLTAIDVIAKYNRTDFQEYIDEQTHKKGMAA